jgi:hypothetical protein
MPEARARGHVRPLIHPRLSEEGRWIPRVRRVLVVVLVANLALASVSAARAWWQVYALSLDAPATLAPGAIARADVQISGRTTVTVRIELVQGARTDTLGSLVVRGNRDGAMDPRPRRARLPVTLTLAMLTGFAPGPARLRATAIGRSQWLRVPPPTVREVPVTLASIPPVP